MNLSPDLIKNKRILIAPLDWGLGHATRCVSLIHKFLKNDNYVLFAGDTLQIELIKKDFPSIEVVELKGYEIRLDSEKSTYWQMIRQSKKIQNIIKKEGVWAEELVEKYKIDILISDNRYGFYSKSVKNIFITHQLNLQIPFFKNLTNKRLKKLISKFDACWIPDQKENPICGNLLKAELGCDTEFIGLLSRFKKLETEAKYDFLFIISGAEPEKSRFGKSVYNLLEANEANYLIVGNIPNFIDKNYIYNPSTAELELLIAKSQCVITRAGYTSVMEFISLEKKTIMIPTKGQYEQEYLSQIINTEFITFITESELTSYLFDK